MEGMEKICQFLDKVQTYYLATVEGDQPRVRPFGTILLWDGKLYIQSGKAKAVSKQIAANPKVELSAWDGEKWLRLSGELVEDDRVEVKKAMLEKMPHLRNMYNEEDGNMLMLYFKNATAVFESFTGEKETFEF